VVQAYQGKAMLVVQMLTQLTKNLVVVAVLAQLAFEQVA
jgi:hypothetical protein